MLNKLRWATVAVVAAIVGMLALAGPAQAVESVVKYQNGNCIGINDGSIQTSQPVDMISCSGTKANWGVTTIDSDWNGHPIARFINKATGLCLDTLGHGLNQGVWTYACNTGHYQWFEVFTNSNGTRTFKSYAAYYDQGGQHLCLEDNGNGLPVTLQTCTSAANQQFTRVGVS